MSLHESRHPNSRLLGPALACLLAAAPGTAGVTPQNAPPDLSSRAPALAPGVLAQIGDYTLTRELFEAYWTALPASQRNRFEADGGKRAFLDELVRQKLLVAEAVRLGYLERPDLKAAAELARDAVLYRAITEEEVTRKIVTDDAVRKFYEANQDRYQVPEQLRVRHILVTPFKDTRLNNETGDDAATSQDAEAKIERLQLELAGGADFAKLARKWSEDVSAANGGLLAEFERGRMSKPFEDAAFALAPGATSGIVRTPYGMHIIRLEERLPAHVAPLEQVLPAVTYAVGEELRDAFQPRYEQLADEARKRHPVVLDEAGVAALADAAARPAPPASESPAKAKESTR